MVANITTNSSDVEVNYELIFRQSKCLGMDYFEFRQSLTFLRNTSDGYLQGKTYRISSGTSLDIYPVNSLIIRAHIDATRYIDNYYNFNNYWTLAFDLKVSLKF